MKKIIMLLLVLFALTGCEQATIDVPETPAVAETTETPVTETVKPYYVKNSVWADVNISTISPARSAAPSVDEALEIIAEYNEENNGDQLRLYTTDVPITEAPTVDVYIAKAVDGYYEILIQVLGMERTYYVQNKQYFELDAINQGGVLFVDKVPEAVPIVVPVVDTRTPYEKYAIYAVITETGKIYLEEHCQNEWDSVYSKETNCLYTSVEDYFNHRLSAFNQEAQRSGWTIYSGCIYTEPAD